MSTTSTRPLIGRPDADTVQLDRRLQAILEDTLISSPNCVELRPDPLATYQERLLTTRPHPAEVFHANSCIVPGWGTNRPKDPQLVAAVRAWYHQTAYAPNAGDVDEAVAEKIGVRVPVSHLPVPLASVLGSGITDPELNEALFAVDLWPLVDDRVYRLPAGADTVWLERTMNGDEARRLRGSLFGLPPAVEGASLVMLVLSPWRYQLFCGTRGYRHALVDVGKALAALARLAARDGFLVADTLDFVDCEVNRMLDLDGVERTCVAACLLAPKEDRP